MLKKEVCPMAVASVYDKCCCKIVLPWTISEIENDEILAAVAVTLSRGYFLCVQMNFPPARMHLPTQTGRETGIQFGVA